MQKTTDSKLNLTDIDLSWRSSACPIAEGYIGVISRNSLKVDEGHLGIGLYTDAKCAVDH
jgi:hypothetical protein